MNRMKGLGVFFCLIMGLNCWGQDTIRIMYYNILNFPNETPERVTYLRKIIQYAQPDILVVNELLTLDGANLILNEGLNTWGATNFQGANFINGPDTDNMLYYNSDKLGFIQQAQVPTTLRDISEYQLYYKSPGLSLASDTIKLNLYSVHLKAGSGFFAQRKEEVQTLKFHLNTKSGIENVFVGGDFNFYSGNESGCLTLRDVGAVKLFDPIDEIGDWSSNSAYASIHTQSTRTSPLDDGSGGGMDDRFDLIFTTADVADNTNGLRLLSDSYQALGQDGERYNGSIVDPYNASVPDSISEALYFMSDHLPVMMDVVTDYTADLYEQTQIESIKGWFSANEHSVVFNTTLPTTALFTLMDVSGKIIIENARLDNSRVGVPRSIDHGIYIYTVLIDGRRISGKLFL